MDITNKSKIYYELINAAIYNNSYHPITPWAHSIGLRSHSLKYREQSSQPSIAEDFLVNSKNTRDNPEVETSILRYLDDPGMMMISLNGQEEEIPAWRKIILPKGPPLDLGLGETLTLRRSIRNFTGDPVSFEALATILRASNGISNSSDVQFMNGETVRFCTRTAPSAGALYPIELYIAALNVKNLSQGIYRYHPVADSLIALNDEKNVDALLNSFYAPEDTISLSQASIIILFFANHWKTIRKYGDRGLRFVFHEAGSIAQNINLASASLGLGSVDSASYYDDELQTAMGINHSVIVHTQIIGIA